MERQIFLLTDFVEKDKMFCNVFLVCLAPLNLIQIIVPDSHKGFG